MAIPQRPSTMVVQTPVAQPNNKIVSFTKVTKSKAGQRIILYGPGGVGKSTLACMASELGPCAFIDADESLGKLRGQLEAQDIELPNLVPANNWETLRDALQSSGWDGVKNIILDAWPPIELWAMRYTLQKTLKDGGKFAKSIEDYGFGKGYRHVYDTFLPLLGDLDAHMRAGRNIIIIGHDETSKVPNPAGTDYIRWEPKMQNTPNASIRYRMKEWADHVLFLTYQTSVATEGPDANKAKGAGFRIMYTAELPHFMAKSRTTSADILIEKGISPWSQIIK